MNYLEKKKQALLNYVSGNQPSGYDVTLRSYSDSAIEVTINGVTTIYTLDEVKANPVDCGCLYLAYRKSSGAYLIVSKGTLIYNGVEYPKGKIVTAKSYLGNAFEYSGVNESTPSGTTEFYIPSGGQCVVFTDINCVAGRAVDFSSSTQIGCIEFMYDNNGTIIIKAIKDLMYNGVVYTSGNQVLSLTISQTYKGVFEEV